MPEVTLRIVVMSGLSSDGAAAFPVLTARGDAQPSVMLAPDGAAAMALTPGEYLFEVLARPMAGVFEPHLHLTYVGGGERTAALSETQPGRWRCSMTAVRTVASVSVTFVGAQSFVFVGANVLTAAENVADAPTFRSAALIGARALFRVLPLGVRRALLASGRRAEWLRRMRTESPSEAPDAAGRAVTLAADADCQALHADFENRLGVARGVTEVGQSADPALAPAEGAAKLVAFYLPQFHAIPENDRWWGKGFTEWRNVAKAIPQFAGHHQPRLPGELGFYDLRTPGVLAQQAALARAHGIGAFCFHYYWFAGKRLLEAPLDAFLSDANIDIDFCLCWANENWTRRWDGDDGQILIGQNHSPEDHQRVFADLARYMNDARYVRIDGKPLLIVYRPEIIADVAELVVVWRREAERRGLPGVYIAATSAFRFDAPEKYGFDALVEFPPHGLVTESIAKRLPWLNRAHAGAVFDYADVARAEAARMRAAKPGNGHDIFPGVMPGWDNEARRPGAGAIYHGATPGDYGVWLQAAVARAARTLPADRRLVFVNAWNEWAEGAHLEPDRAFGRAYLAETARVLASR